MLTKKSRILAADIGGTNARFALFAVRQGGNTPDGPGMPLQSGQPESSDANRPHGPDRLELLEHVTLPTAGFADFPGLLDALPTGFAARALAAVLAIAGPVERGRFCRPPNIPYSINLDALPTDMLPAGSLLINDFTAQAHGCRMFGPSKSFQVLPGDMDPSRTQAVIGAGTGLGKAALIPDGRGGYLVGASEGGHAAFPFLGRDEFDFQRFAMEATAEPYPRWETVVSGLGLSLLHAFHTGERVSPAEAAAALTLECPVADWFARFYGRACRDFVLEVLALGGLYVSGGVAARNPLLLAHPAFREEFRFSATHSALLESIGVRAVHDESAGLWGAAAFAWQATLAE